MSTISGREAEAQCLLALEGSLDARGLPDVVAFPTEVLDSALQALVRQHGAAAGPLLRAMADGARAKATRKAAKRAIYRLAQAGVTVASSAGTSAGPVIKRHVERAIRAWVSGIDGTGSRAAWILFEGGLGGQLQLCSLILNDEVGVLEAAGGSITRKRLEAELRRLREHQKLPWVEIEPTRACALVSEALALHARIGTGPPPEFERWRRFFAELPAAPETPPERGEADPSLVERSAELLELPELAGWFVDPGLISEDALALLQARESRLVVSNQIKAEREAAIVDAVIDEQFTPEIRHRWARRLAEMASVFRSTGREETARLAASVEAALADDSRVARHIPFVKQLAMRGLEVGTEVALGRVKLADVSRAPVRKTEP
ncbi:MAG TPA: hypothetical protein VMS64_23515 [Candidatus Methylomirabilis sp.]|nr:hypothetical protein [Candidatus Methylomirabilis sp.]